MRLVERHIIKIGHQFYEEIDDLAWRSKNLYNYANYLVRQSLTMNNQPEVLFAIRCRSSTFFTIVNSLCSR